jgi:hypothetical protein
MAEILIIFRAAILQYPERVTVGLCQSVGIPEAEFKKTGGP